MLAGTLILPPNTLANRPAANFDGRLFFATDTGLWYRDTYTGQGVFAWQPYGGGAASTGGGGFDASRFFRAAFNGTMPMPGGFNTVKFGAGNVTNDAGSHYDPSTGFYTVPKAGLYRMTGRIARLNDSDSNVIFGMGVAVGKNGGDNDLPQWATVTSDQNNVPQNGCSFIDIVQFAQGDLLRMSVFLQRISTESIGVAVMTIEGLN